MYNVLLHNDARKAFDKLPLRWKKRVAQSIQCLAEDPFIGKKLQGELAHLYSLRVWPYRILYKIIKREVTIFILDIGHRKDIYR